jgi:anaerobic selenocysteine-containing dehydrogenase
MASTREIRAAIGRIVPGLEQIAQIDESKQEFHIPGRTFREPHFPTATGKARLFTHALPGLSGSDTSASRHLRLMTARSEGQFNTVVYEDYDMYRGVDRRDVILVHSADIARLGLVADQAVRVRSEAGQIDRVVVVPFDQIKAGNALMYYPEANALVPRVIDPQSKTPAFKNVLVTVEPFVGAKPVESVPEAENGSPVAASGHDTRRSMRAC